MVAIIVMDVVVVGRIIALVFVGSVGEGLVNVLGLDLLGELGMLEEVVDWGVRLRQDLSLGQVMLQCLDVVHIARVVLAHVLLECRCVVLRQVPVVFLCVLNRLKNTTCVLLQNVESHLEDVVHFKLIAEALFLVVCVDVAQCLASCRMFDSHRFVKCKLLILLLRYIFALCYELEHREKVREVRAHLIRLKARITSFVNQSQGRQVPLRCALAL